MARKKIRWNYFVQETMTQAIKIGSSFYPDGRIGSLQVGNAYQLVTLGYLDFAEQTEKELHRKFAKHRLKGEWFSKDIASSIKKLLATKGDPRPAAFLADYFEDIIAIERAAVFDPSAKIKEWMDSQGFRPVKGTKGKGYLRAEMQAMFGTLHFTDEANDDEVRRKLMGDNTKPAQMTLF